MFSKIFYEINRLILKTISVETFLLSVIEVKYCTTLANDFEIGAHLNYLQYIFNFINF